MTQASDTGRVGARGPRMLPEQLQLRALKGKPERCLHHDMPGTPEFTPESLSKQVGIPYRFEDVQDPNPCEYNRLVQGSRIVFLPLRDNHARHRPLSQTAAILRP